MKKIVIEQSQPQQGGAYLKVEDGKVLLGIWNGDQESVMVLDPRDGPRIQMFFDDVIAHVIDCADIPRAWHVNGTVHQGVAL